MKYKHKDAITKKQTHMLNTKDYKELAIKPIINETAVLSEKDKNELIKNLGYGFDVLYNPELKFDDDCSCIDSFFFNTIYYTRVNFQGKPLYVYIHYHHIDYEQSLEIYYTYNVKIMRIYGTNSHNLFKVQELKKVY